MNEVTGLIDSYILPHWFFCGDGVLHDHRTGDDNISIIISIIREGKTFSLTALTFQILSKRRFSFRTAYLFKEL